MSRTCSPLATQIRRYITFVAPPALHSMSSSRYSTAFSRRTSSTSPRTSAQPRRFSTAAWLLCALSLNDDISLFRLILRFADDVNLPALHEQLASVERGTKVITVLENVHGGAGLLTKLQRFRERVAPATAELLSLIDMAA